MRILHKEMHALFKGNQRSVGRWVRGAAAENKTVPGAGPTEKDFEEHISGGIGVGVAPILDDGTCYWGAIDIDAHHGKEPIDIPGLAATVESVKLPALVCRSKTGGAHVYVFFKQPEPAPAVRVLLASWAASIGHAGVEVFPKQDHLRPDDTGERTLGSWINMPYHNAEDTPRYCWSGGKALTLEQFLDSAEESKSALSELRAVKTGDHPEAPPCIQAILKNGVGKGMRNEALFSMTVYAKKVEPEKFRDLVASWNDSVFEEPLPLAELRKTISSVARRDYKYRCQQRPCKDYCDSAVCVTRAHGIGQTDKQAMDAYRMPSFSDLHKHLTEPVRWVMTVDATQIRLSTPELMDYQRLRVVAAEKLTRVIPPIKNEDWHLILDAMMQKAVIVEEPPETKASGILHQKLTEFLRRCDLESDPDNKDNRAHILRGIPVRTRLPDRSVVLAFRGGDLQEFLRKNRADELAGPNLWFVLKEVGADHCEIKIGGTKRNVWYVPDDFVKPLDLPSPDNNTEF